MKLLIAFVAVCVISSATAVAGTFWVAEGGSDANDGGKDAPWATLQHAVDTVSPGDVIVVADGTYAGFRIRKSGTAAAPITLRAENKWGAVLRGSAGKCHRKAVVEINADDDGEETIGYWKLDGFEIDGAGAANCVLPVVTTHVTVTDCKMHDSEWVCIMSGHSHYMLLENNITYGSKKSHGIYMSNSADHGVLRGNRTYHNGKAGIHMNGDLSCGGDGVMTDWLVEKNTAYDNGLVAGGGAINCDGVSDSVFRNNLLYGNHRTGMTFYAIDATEGSSRNLVANNTIVMAPGAYEAILMPRMKELPPMGSRSVDQLPPLAGKRQLLSPTANRFFNNIIIASSPDAAAVLVYDPKATGLESDYNCISGRFDIDGEETIVGIDEWRSLGHGKHSIAADPKDIFVAPDANDYHLKKGSPAIDAGTALEDVTEDIEGTPRPQGAAYDIGCYEAKAD